MTPGAVPATMGKRLLAHLIDQVAYLLVGGAFVLGGVLALRGSPDVATLSPLSVIGLVLLLGIGIFQWWYQGTRGFTIGKRLVGLRTLSAETGRPVGMGRVLLRMLVVAAGTLVVGIGQAVVYLSPFFDPTGRRQGWHDKAAGTMVFDILVGRDPAEADQVRGAAEALRRLDTLMQHTGAGSSGGSAARGEGPDAAARRLQPELVPAGSAVAAPHLTPPYPPVTAPTVAPPPVTAPTPLLAPRLPARPAPPGVISAVPTAGESAPTTAPQAAVSAPGNEARRPDPTPATPAAPGASAPRPSQPSAASRAPVASSGLAEDVEMTRMRPARGKVPEVGAGDEHSEATIELTDGRRFVLVGTALVGRLPTPRSGEDDAQLIRVSDPGRSVSKTHLVVGVDRTGVWIRDRDSTNGTVVTLQDGQQILCAAEQQVRVPTGATVAFGDYGLTVVDAGV